MNDSSKIKKLESLMICDQTNKEEFCGACQCWFKDSWRRKVGCAPTVVATMLLYHMKKNKVISCKKDTILKIMNHVWDDVTPTYLGITSTTMLKEHLNQYANNNELTFEIRTLDIDSDLQKRVSVEEVERFIETGLKDDCIIAFLNLCNGAEENLDYWHWVSIAALKTNADGNTYLVICDEGICKEIDLALWLRTTSLGGGFLYFK